MSSVDPDLQLQAVLVAEPLAKIQVQQIREIRSRSRGRHQPQLAPARLTSWLGNTYHLPNPEL